MSKTLHFTKDEVRALRESWYTMWGDKTNTGIKILTKLFKMHPESRPLFKEFKDLREEDMLANKRFRGLALSIMYKLGEFIDSLEDVETLEELMINTCKSHHKRTVGPKEFKWMPAVMSTVVKETMKARLFTDLHKTSWCKLMEALVTISSGVQRTLKEDAMDKIEIPEMSGFWKSPRNSPLNSPR